MLIGEDGNFNLTALTAKELLDHINDTSCGIHEITAMRLDLLGLAASGQENNYGYQSWSVAKELLVQLHTLMAGTFKGDEEAKKFAWKFFYRAAISQEFAEECYQQNLISLPI